MTSESAFHDAEFIVASEVMTKFMAMVERVARHVGTVLIVGETGTGKERITHAIHQQSLRCNKPFVEINCAALPESLAESELFGYEKGAFSGADTAKPGLFEVAHQGTIFLDEIGELDLKLQVKLLRILDRAPYYRLGGHRKISVDVRVIAATNRNLKDEVSEGRFRKDLYHRLSQFELRVPTLRERPEDIVALAEHFLARESKAHKFSADALRVLQTHSWPGNVRELQNLVNRLWVSAGGPVIGAAEVGEELERSASEFAAPKEHKTESVQLDTLEAGAIGKALEQTGGHRGRAAAQLGISRRTLSRKLRHYGLASSRDASSQELGSLDYEQQQSFRAELRMPVTVYMIEASAELKCTAVNLSVKGLGVEGLSLGADSGRLLRVHFCLPGQKTPIHALARMAWADGQGRAGLAFSELDAASRTEIQRWLRNKMLQEGWTVPPTNREEQQEHAKLSRSCPS